MTTNQEPVKKKSSHNLVLRIGLWVTVIAGALWAGGKLINLISVYLPFAIGAGILMLAVGLYMQYQTSKKAEKIPQQ